MTYQDRMDEEAGLLGAALCALNDQLEARLRDCWSDVPELDELVERYCSDDYLRISDT